jgi:hypothetical protein
MTSAPPAPTDPTETLLRSAAPIAPPAATESAAPAFVKRHSVLTYYAVVFAISWGGFLLVGGRGLVSGTNWQSDPQFQTAVLALLAGPPVAGLLLTGLVSGRAGLRELLARLLRWRVAARWYAVALLTAPLLMTATLLALSLLSPQFLPAVVKTDDDRHGVVGRRRDRRGQPRTGLTTKAPEAHDYLRTGPARKDDSMPAMKTFIPTHPLPTYSATSSLELPRATVGPGKAAHRLVHATTAVRRRSRFFGAGAGQRPVLQGFERDAWAGGVHAGDTQDAGRFPCTVLRSRGNAGSGLRPIDTVAGGR